MRTFARAEDDIWKKLFLRVASRGLKRENKTYKLKKSITTEVDVSSVILFSANRSDEKL